MAITKEQMRDVEYRDLEKPDYFRVEGMPKGLEGRFCDKKKIPFLRKLGYRDPSPAELKAMNFELEVDEGKTPEFEGLRFQVIPKSVMDVRRAKKELRNQQAERNIKQQLVTEAKEASKELVRKGYKGNINIESKGHGFKRERITLGDTGEE